MKRALLTTLLLWLCVAVPAPAADPAEAQRLIEQTAAETKKALAERQAELQADPDAVFDLVEDILLPHADFEAIAQLVLGRHWRTASPEQRQRFTEEFRDLIVRTYARSLLAYQDFEIRTLPLRPSNKDDRTTVRAEVVTGERPPIQVDYTMCHRGGRWKICNVTIDRTINFVINYRKQIDEQIRRDGLDGVIAMISDRNARMAVRQ